MYGLIPLANTKDYIIPKYFKNFKPGREGVYFVGVNPPLEAKRRLILEVYHLPIAIRLLSGPVLDTNDTTSVQTLEIYIYPRYLFISLCHSPKTINE